MTWVKLDDGFFRNGKSRAVGKDGRALYLAGLCYCAGTLTDGFIPQRDLALVAAEAEVKTGVASKLVENGLWRTADGGWQIPDFLTYNRSAEVIKREREEGRQRAERSRERKANAKANAQAKKGRTSANGSADPSSSRPLIVDVSGQSSSVVPVDGEDDDWATIVAKQRLADRVREVGRVRSPKKWLVTTVANVHDDHDGEAARWLEKNPDWSPAQVADAIENPQTARAEPGPSCSECDSGWVLDDRGDAVPCPVCKAA